MTLHNETLLTGYDAEGKLVFCKAYNYETQKEECQKDCDTLIAGGYAWVMGKAVLQLRTDAEEQALDLLKRIAEDKFLTEDLEEEGYPITDAIKGEMY